MRNLLECDFPAHAFGWKARVRSHGPEGFSSLPKSILRRRSPLHLVVRLVGAHHARAGEVEQQGQEQGQGGGGGNSRAA